MRTYNGKRILITLTLACLLVFGLVRVCNSSESSAQASVDQSKISYVSVLIHSSDTLSSIANEYSWMASALFRIMPKPSKNITV